MSCEYDGCPIEKFCEGVPIGLEDYCGGLMAYRKGKADERKKVLDDAEKLLDKITPDKVAEIKCDDGEIRNRPLIDIAKVYEILEQMKGEYMETAIIRVPTISNKKNITNGSIVSALILKAFEDALFLPMNATNGDIIKALFPKVDDNFSNVIDLKLWWNAKYNARKGGEKNDNT